MMHTRARVLSVALAILWLIASAANVAASTGKAPAAPAMVRLPGHVLSALAKATEVNEPLDSRGRSIHDSDPLTITIVLKRDDQAGFERYLKDVYDPHSKNFRHFLTPRQVSDRFGPSRRDYAAVSKYLKDNGFRTVKRSANRMTLTMRGTRAQAEHACGVAIKDFQQSGRAFYASTSEPTLPENLAASVQGIVGLTRVPKPASMSLVGAELVAQLEARIAILKSIRWDPAALNTFSDGSGGGLGGGMLATEEAELLLEGEIAENTILLYETKAILAAEVGLFARPIRTGPTGSRRIMTGAHAAATAQGAGQTIGLLAFSSFEMSDVADWLAWLGLSSNLINQVSEVKVSGGASLGPDEGDVLLGIDTILAIAPGANVVVYDTPSDGSGAGFQALFNQMINDNVNVISNSFGYCEDQTTAVDAQTIDSILSTAAASGITVLNATGDYGAACSDGSANTIAVPADSPNATAVGGTTPQAGPGTTYQSETWFDGSSQVPPSGQSGFGVSQFFGAPYQNGLAGGGMRSVPDVVAIADPNFAPTVCEADAGGCPTGLVYGGTSLSTPIWAAFTALLNQAVGHPLGNLNLDLYPLAGTASFHSAASMGTDFAHVGLGSPNMDSLYLALAGLTAGPPSSSVSTVTAASTVPFVPFLGDVPADGSSMAAIVVRLYDASGNLISGKNVTLSGNAGSSAQIMPASGVSSTVDGSVTFMVTDANVEDVTFAATDTTDVVTLAQTAAVNFIGPPATVATINSNPASVAAGGGIASTITITLTDASNNPAPKKQVSLAQGSGHSNISGPASGVTNSSGEIQFSVTDNIPETVTYTATDVTDANEPVPGSAMVQFTGAGNPPNCSLGVASVQPGANFAIQQFATGFQSPDANTVLGNLCYGPTGMAFDPSGNMYVATYFEGNIYKFGPSGGTANPAQLVTTTPYPSTNCLSGLAFSKDGQHLYMGRQFCGEAGSDVVEISPTDGSIIRELVTGIGCATALATDPISGDLFLSQPCDLPVGSNNILRISNPESTSPTTSVYASPGQSSNLAFAPDGTLYTASTLADIDSNFIVSISGTNSAVPGQMNYITNDYNYPSAVVPALNPLNISMPPFLLIDDINNIMSELVLPIPPPPAQQQPTQVIGGGSQGLYGITGPDGCAYMTQSDRILKITAADGTCNFAASSAFPTLSLSPSTVTPNPAQGTQKSFTATLSNVTVPAGSPVTLAVVGPNLQEYLSRTNANNQATFTYTGALTGTDILTAKAIVGTQTLISNKAQVTWIAGQDTTFCNLNLSATGGIAGAASTLTASLFDISVTPAVPVPDTTLTFHLEGNSCTAMTNSMGSASCSITPNTSGAASLTVTFAGNSNLLACNANTNFNVTAPTPTPTTTMATMTPTPTPTPTPPPATPTPTMVATATATASKTPVPTATMTPVPTATRTPVPTATRTPIPTATRTPIPTATRTPIPTATLAKTPCPTATATRTPCPTATKTPVPTATRTPIPTATLAKTPCPTATATRTPCPTATKTPVPTATRTPIPTATRPPTPTPTPTPIATGKIGPLYVVPPVLDFGGCLIGQHGSILIAWLANPIWNNGPATVSSIAIQGSADFSIVPNATTCKSTLGVGQLCSIAVQFNPLAGGSRAGELVIQDNALNSPQVVLLSGEGDFSSY